MIICINCSIQTKQKMDNLLDQDHYRDYSELIALAIENQWLLDREVAAKGALVIGESTSLPVAPSIPQPENISVSRPAQPHKPFNVSLPPIIRTPLIIPDIFLPDGLDSLSVPKLDIQKDESNANETFTLDLWLFGQYNKLLPAKANCRAILRITAKNEYGAPLEEATQCISEAGALLGDYLADFDRRHQIGREDALATAFPRSGPNAEKGRYRYANQFVGSVNSHGKLSGLLYEYRLAGLVTGDGMRLLLTEQGMNFAKLSNPILDGWQTDLIQKFTPEEVAFLLDHIRAFVPKEEFAFRTLLKAIDGGADTPEKLNEALYTLAPNDSNRSLSPSFLASQRSGALSRMSDLGLITRERKGVRVSYIVSQQGQSFIESK